MQGCMQSKTHSCKAKWSGERSGCERAEDPDTLRRASGPPKEEQWAVKETQQSAGCGATEAWGVEDEWQ